MTDHLVVFDNGRLVSLTEARERERLERELAAIEAEVTMISAQLELQLVLTPLQQRAGRRKLHYRVNYDARRW